MHSDDETESPYFLEALKLFHETQWLYKFPVTEILAKNLMNEIPRGWITSLKELSNQELNDLVVNKATKDDWPETLLSFVEKCVRLDRLPRIIESDVEKLPQSFRKGLSLKKQHEIVRLANLVHSQCAANGIDTIVDLGSGLGYVSQLLNFLYGYRVLGLESQSANVEAARRRQKDLYPSSLPLVHYRRLKIDRDSADEIRSCLRESFDGVERNFCLVGLHACGDLGVDACRLFGDISSAKIFIIVSCCYHKLDMRVADGDEQRFLNFPASRCLKNVLDSSQLNCLGIFQRPFLRLACQEPAERWDRMTEKAHREHAFHVLARGALELFAQKNTITLKKRVQKATRKSQCANFRSYLEDAFLRYEFIRDDAPLEPVKIRDEILSTWTASSGESEAAEIYTGLQLMLQSPAEFFVLNDRRCWLNEMGYESEIIPVTSRTLSPRSHAIVSRKTNLRVK